MLFVVCIDLYLSSWPLTFPLCQDCLPFRAFLLPFGKVHFSGCGLSVVCRPLGTGCGACLCVCVCECELHRVYPGVCVCVCVCVLVCLFCSNN